MRHNNPRAGGARVTAARWLYRAVTLVAGLALLVVMIEQRLWLVLIVSVSFTVAVGVLQARDRRAAEANADPARTGEESEPPRESDA
jgi:hypothetical protein